MAIPVANLSAVVTGAVSAVMAFAVEMLPANVARDAALGAATVSVASFLRYVWSWLVAAAAVVVENGPTAAAAAAEASWQWLQMPGELLRLLYGWVASGSAAAAAAARTAAGSAAEASEQWLSMAAKLLHVLYGWVVATTAMAAENLPDAAAAAKHAAGSMAEPLQPLLEMAWKLWYERLAAASAVSVENLPTAAVASVGGAGSTAEASSPSRAAATWFLNGHGGAVCVALLVLALLAAAFLAGVVWALTCRSMKAPGVRGARVPRAMFEASPRSYYATVRAARKARRSASGGEWKLLLLAAPMVACAAYLVAKKL